MMIKGGIRIGGLGISGFDADAAAYFERAGVTDATAKNQINAFVKGIKALGLYNNMVCWPLRSAQNAGTGLTAYSLGGLGTYDGTLTGSPTRGADGISLIGTPAPSITTAAFANQPDSIFSVQKFETAVSNNQVVYDGTNRQHLFRNITNNTIDGFAGSVVPTTTPGTFIDAFSSFQLKFNGASGSASINGGSATTLNFGANNLTNFRMGGNAQQGVLLSFAMIINANTSENFYTHYKTTLGTGLGLP